MNNYPVEPIPRARSFRFRPPWKLIKRLLVIGVFLGFVGLPHMRLTYHYVGSSRDPYVTDGKYLGPFGLRYVGASDFEPGCPLFLLIPFDGEMLSNIQMFAHWLVDEGLGVIGISGTENG